MKRTLTVLLSVAMMVSMINTAAALPAEPTEAGTMFGGQWTSANNASAQVTELGQLKSVVEVFTATWCENCVDVEHALEDVQAAGLLQQYHIHRSIGETQDPFGTDELDQRWKDKYGYDSPPTVVLNGSMKKIGSVADDGTLVNEFTNLANTDLELGNGTTAFSWTPTNTQTGTVVWDLDIEEQVLEGHDLHVTVWWVEAHADFEEGTNGLSTYPHIVHAIVDLGDALNGSASLTVPEAHDGNDMEIHLIYELSSAEMMVNPAPPVVVEDEAMPWMNAWSSLAAVVAVALTRRPLDPRQA